jgi:nifR3 family TIM-barrel protein
MRFGFWKQLARPFTALAPMSGITDAAYRRIIARYGKPDVMFAGFVPADGLDSIGRDNLAHNLWKTEAERPIVAQIYGGNPRSFERAAEFLVGLGFDGIDINMGCPAKKVEKREGGSALIRDPRRAQEIIAAAQAGAGDLPVSVKTRIGYSVDEIETWLASLLNAKPAAITLHARTREDGYKPPARWCAIARAVELAAQLQRDREQRPLIIGNGDVQSLAEAYIRAEQTGCDGVMVGRGITGNPWFFSRQSSRSDQSPARVLEVMLEHTELYLELYDGIKPLELMKKHFKAYVHGFDGAAKLRAQLMRVNDPAELRQIVSEGAGLDA